MIPVNEASVDGGQITTAGQLQFGAMLLGGGTSAGWVDLIGWRDLPDAALGDSERPQAHGVYPGTVFGGALAVTYQFLLRGTPEQKQADLAVLERYTRMDGVERTLAVDDGDGVWLRNARVIGRSIPQGKHFTHAPVSGSIQFLCADPRRYSIAEHAGNAVLAGAVGGLIYALSYPLDYGTLATGTLTLTNNGGEPAPLVATFVGPLTNPAIVTSGWRMGFDLELATGETLVVDTAAGTALLNGTADRLYTITASSDPVDVCLLAPGSTTLALTASAGTGLVQIAFRDARM